MKNFVNTRRRQKGDSQFSLAQQSLLSEAGYVPFNYGADAFPVRGVLGMFEISGMRFLLAPVPKNPPWAFERIHDALRVFYLERKRWKYRKPGHIEPIQLDSWECSACTVSTRHQIDDGIIRATYSRPNDQLELSIPHPQLWKESGLRWLSLYTFCCERNIENPTPWLGPSCGCKERVRLTALADARRHAAARSITTNTHIFCSHD